MCPLLRVTQACACVFLTSPSLLPSTGQNGELYITGFMEGTSAENCGLEEGDIITAVDGVCAWRRTRAHTHTHTHTHTHKEGEGEGERERERERER